MPAISSHLLSGSDAFARDELSGLGVVSHASGNIADHCTSNEEVEDKCNHVA